MSVRVETFHPSPEVHICDWSVPLLQAYERDGGMVDLVIDRRMAVTVDAAHFERVAEFVADVIGVCWGYGAHPRDSAFNRDHFARVPHPSLAPRHQVEISAVETEASAE